MSRFPRFAFSLRTLVIFVLLVGSVGGLWYRWEPWVCKQLGGARLVSDDGSVSATHSESNVTLRGIRIAFEREINLERIQAVQLSPNGRKMAAHHEYSIGVWDTQSGQCQFDIKTTFLYAGLSFSPDGELLLALGLDLPTEKRALRLYRTDNGELVQEFPADTITNAVVSKDRRFVVTADSTGAIVKWQIRDAKKIAQVKVEEVVRSNCLVSSPDGLYLLVECAPGRVFGIDAASFEITHVLSATLGTRPTVTPSEFVAGNYGRGVAVYDLKSFQQIRSFPCADYPMHAVVSPDRGQVLTADGDLWSFHSSHKLAQFGRVDAGWFLDKDTVLIHEQHVLELWHRRRPEQWFGLAWLPEFWATLLFAGAFCWSVWRDRRQMQAIEKAPPSISLP
jgi:hypothetical protein